MSVRGIFSSNSGIVGDRVSTLASRILMNGYGGTAPLLALSSGMPNEPVSDTAFSWLEDSHISGNTTATGTVNAAAASVNVADSNVWVPNTIVMNEATGEYILVTSVAGNAIGIARGMLGTTAAQITAADKLQLISSIHPEAGGKPAPVSQNGVSITNLVQIFKNGWAISGTAQKIGFVTGNKLAQNKEQAMAYHAEDIERAFLWGRKGQFINNNEVYRASQGILGQIENYGGLVESAAYGGTPGQMSLKGLQSFMRRIFDRQVKGYPNERITFTGSQTLENIQNMIRMEPSTQITITPQTNEFGFNVSVLSFIGHQLKFMTHPLMVENDKWSKELYVLHPGLIKTRTLRTTWTEEFSTQRQNNNGKDATEGYIAIEKGFQAQGVASMGILRNIATPVVS